MENHLQGILSASFTLKKGLTSHSCGVGVNATLLLYFIRTGLGDGFLSFFCVICAIFHILTFLKRVIFISIFLLFQCNKWGSILLYKFYSFEKGSNIYGFFNEHTGKLCKKRLFLNQEYF